MAADASEKTNSLVLEPDGPIFFAGDVGQTLSQACPVVALNSRTQTPAKGVEVRFRVVRGVARFQPGNRSEMVIRTGENGVASPEVVFSSVGSGLIAANLGNDEETTVLFEGHSDQTTHQLYIYSSPVSEARSGQVRARIVARDHHDHPVRKADIFFEGKLGADTFIRGTVKEVGNGEYEGTFKNNAAGCWTLTAKDRSTSALVRECVQVVPGPAKKLVVNGTLDPRIAPPYDRLMLRASLLDQFGNTLDPHRLRCKAGASPVRPEVLVEDEARFPIRFAGYGSVPAVLSDAESKISTKVSVLFAAAWLQVPEFVNADETFDAPLFLIPPPKRAVKEATINIQFDPAQVSFLGIRSIAAGVTATATAKGKTLTVSLRTEQAIRSDRSPQGVMICTTQWRCQKEGTTCFVATAQMSPPTEPWKLCVEQKRARQKCLCINIIYKAGDWKALRAGQQAARQTVTILSTGNIQRCCPSLRLGLSSCAISAKDWTDKILAPLGAAKKISSSGDFDAVFNANLCQKAKCINFIMIDIDPAYADGLSSVGPKGGTDHTFGAINPDKVGSVHNMGAHEAGHALGLDHEPNTAVDNVMKQYQPHGDKLTADQCKTIFQNVDKYPCP